MEQRKFICLTPADEVAPSKRQNYRQSDVMRIHKTITRLNISMAAPTNCLNGENPHHEIARAFQFSAASRTYVLIRVLRRTRSSRRGAMNPCLARLVRPAQFETYGQAQLPHRAYEKSLAVNHQRDVLLISGTRPEIIKLAPVYHALRGIGLGAGAVAAYGPARRDGRADF